MSHPAITELFLYWNCLRGQKSAPERSAIDPCALRAILSDTLILEAAGDGTFPIRIAGERTNRLFQREWRGQSFLDMWHEQDQSDMRYLMKAITHEARAVIIGAEAVSSHRPHLTMELLLLPLRDKGRSDRRILGCLVPTQITSWFGLVPAQTMTLTSGRILRPEDMANQMMEFGRLRMSA